MYLLRHGESRRPQLRPQRRQKKPKAPSRTAMSGKTKSSARERDATDEASLSLVPPRSGPSGRARLRRRHRVRVCAWSCPSRSDRRACTLCSLWWTTRSSTRHTRASSSARTRRVANRGSDAGRTRARGAATDDDSTPHSPLGSGRERTTKQRSDRPTRESRTRRARRSDLPSGKNV